MCESPVCSNWHGANKNINDVYENYREILSVIICVSNRTNWPKELIYDEQTSALFNNKYMK